jgi:pyruvate kinase
LVEALGSFEVGSRRHVNLPDIDYQLVGMTDADKRDVLFAIKNKFSYIAMSFVSDRKDVVGLRKFLNKNNGSQLKIISKIENQQ